MKVITERDLLTLLRKKQLQIGGQYEVETPYVLTPSARSLLRDKQIQLVEETPRIVKTAAVHKVSSENSVSVPDGTTIAGTVHGTLADAVEHLVQLLYFPLLPDSFFSPLVWQHIEQQQQQLRQWQESSFMISLDNIVWSYPGERADFRSCTWRAWCYSVGEVARQIKKVRRCLVDSGLDESSFMVWADSCMAFLDNKEVSVCK